MLEKIANMDLTDEETRADFLEFGYKIRDKYLNGIKSADIDAVIHYRKLMESYDHNDGLNLLNRIPQDKLRSMKNIYLGQNTLCAHIAREGGLSASQSHYISEKYAILIEHSDTIPQLEQLYLKMLEVYADPSLRTKTEKNSTIVQRTKNYMMLNFAEDISIEKIARKLHVHPSHLMRLFKQETGITISNYRNQRRLKEAKELLQSNLSITDIAFMVGFSSSQYFSRIFRKEEGMTPSVYRKNNWKK